MQSAEVVASRGGVALREVGICVVICPVFLCPCAAVCPPLLASSGIPLHHGKCQSARPRPSVFSICSPLPFCCDSCIYVWCRRPSRAFWRHAIGPTVLFLFCFNPMCIRFILYVYVTSVCLSWMLSCGCDNHYVSRKSTRPVRGRGSSFQKWFAAVTNVFFHYLFCLVYCA